MSDQELSFVNCPSCGSLIPSTAIRCRMCGFDMSQVRDGGEGEDTANRGRVKQKTLSLSKEELADYKDESGVEESRGFRFRGREKDSVSTDATGRVPPDRYSSGQGPSQNRSENTGSRTREVERRDPDAQREPRVRPETMGESRPEARQESRPEPRTEARPEPRPEPPRFEPRAERVKAERENEIAAEKFVEKPHPERPANESATAPTGGRGFQGAPSSPNQSANAASQQSFKESAPKGFQRRGEESAPARQVASAAPRPESPAPAKEEKKLTKTMAGGLSRSSGRLVGWFVHYHEAEAEPVEVYSGKFLVSGTRLRDSDLVIQDNSLSTPHAIINSSGDSIILLDLMSEKGTALMRVGEKEFRSINEQVSVNHGDRVRFGNYEMLICTVPKIEVAE